MGFELIQVIDSGRERCQVGQIEPSRVKLTDLLEPVHFISFSMLCLSFDKSFSIIPHTITLSTVSYP